MNRINARKKIIRRKGEECGMLNGGICGFEVQTRKMIGRDKLVAANERGGLEIANGRLTCIIL